MQYPDGQTVKVGDRVGLGDDDGGIVVCSIDDDEYSESYPKEAWEILEKGVLILFPLYGLIHYINPESGLRLISRGEFCKHNT